MPGKRVDGMGQHGLSADQAELLGNVAACAAALTCCDQQCDRSVCHGRACIAAAGQPPAPLRLPLQRISAKGCLFFRQRSEEHTSELQSLMRISYAVFCLKKKITGPNCEK